MDEDRVMEIVNQASQISDLATTRDYLGEHQRFVIVENVAASFQRG
jgi:hypothetical protein